MIEISDAAGSVTYRNSFITDLPVNRDAVGELAAAGRARWKIENEAFNVLKTTGYNLEHNFGHGQRHLSTVLATLNLLAFACHTVCELGSNAWRRAMRELVTRQVFFRACVSSQPTRSFNRGMNCSPLWPSHGHRRWDLEGSKKTRHRSRELQLNSADRDQAQFIAGLFGVAA
jgi:hypothetical protein